MIMKQRELIADSLFIKSKKEKITLIEALVKLHNYENQRKLLSNTIINSYSLSLISYKSKKLNINERYNHLFNKNIKKTFYSILICLFVLLTNVSMITIASNVLYDADKNNIEESFMIGDLEVVEKKIDINNVKYVFRVFENYYPNLYKKCVVYYILLDYHNTNFSQRDLIETVRLLVNN
jgi:hypothetical protein